MHFTDGAEIKTKEEVKYLGCNLNKHADGQKELQKRIATCMTVLKRLDLFWRHSDCSLKRKLVVYDLDIRSKLLYGLESLQLTEATINKLDVFQLKGLRTKLCTNWHAQGARKKS